MFSSRSFRFLTVLLLLGGTAVLPAPVDARPGSGMSFGSRGSRTYSAPPVTRSAPTGASPFGRDTMAAPRTPYGAPYGTPYGGGMMGRGGHPLAAGLLGGFLGAGLAGMLMGHSFYHGGFGMGGLFGLLLQLALIYFVVRWLLRRFSGQSSFSRARAGGGLAYTQPGLQTRGAANGGWARGGAMGGAMGGLAGGTTGGATLALTQSDYTQFEQTLRDVQSCWTRADFSGLQQVTTPEMAATLSQQLQELRGRGVRNAVSDVRLEQGDLSEAWSESGRDYATVSMRYSMIDVTTDASGRVVDGSPNERVSVVEFWTFLRTGGSRWVLSAIQQTR